MPCRKTKRRQARIQGRAREFSRSQSCFIWCSCLNKYLININRNADKLNVQMLQFPLCLLLFPSWLGCSKRSLEVEVMNSMSYLICLSSHRRELDSMPRLRGWRRDRTPSQAARWADVYTFLPPSTVAKDDIVIRVAISIEWFEDARYNTLGGSWDSVFRHCEVKEWQSSKFDRRRNGVNGLWLKWSYFISSRPKELIGSSKF